MVPLEQVQSNDPWIWLSMEKYNIRKIDPVLYIRMKTFVFEIYIWPVQRC